MFGTREEFESRHREPHEPGSFANRPSRSSCSLARPMCQRAIRRLRRIPREFSADAAFSSAGVSFIFF